MSAKLSAASLDHAIHLYLSGEPLEKIQSTSGVSVTRLQRERVSRGIPSRKTLRLPSEEIVSQYLAGASENALSIQYGVSRGPITRILADAGVERRGMSEAGVVRNQQMTAAERRQQVAAANRASRLRSAPQIQKHRRALRIEAEGAYQSAGEQLLSQWLSERGVKTIPQRAVGVYNVDLAALPVAVEILGGGWHSIKAAHGERTPYILDEGWHLVMVWDSEGCSALGSGAADYLVAFLDEIRRNPPATCQYRVITGQGEVLAACGRESDHFPLEPPPRSAL